MRAITLIILVLSGMSVFSQTTLTLDKCREMALENNVRIRNSRQAIVASKETRREAFTKYFPEISASGLAFQANHDVMQYNVMDMFTLGLIRKGISGSVSFTQPIFVGGRIVNGNKLAEIGEAVSELQLRQSREEVTLTVDQYYWKLATLVESRKTVNEVIAMLDTLTYQINIAVEAGVTTKNDLLEVTLRRNEMESAAIDLDNGIGLCGMLLAQYIGMSEENITLPEDLFPMEVPNLSQDIYRDPANSVSATVGYQLLQEKIKGAKLNERIELGKNLPTVGVGGGWFYEDIVAQGHNFGAVFLSVSVPISGWWGGSHAIRNKKAQTLMARNELEDATQLLQIKMKNAWDELTSAHRKMGLAKESIAQSAENLRMYDSFYHAGTATITDLLQAQTLYRQSQDRYFDAYATYRIKIIEYMQTTGQI